MRRGQYPNPTFLDKAEGIKKERHTKFVVGAAAAVLIVLTVIFIKIGADMQFVGISLLIIPVSEAAALVISEKAKIEAAIFFDFIKILLKF